MRAIPLFLLAASLAPNAGAQAPANDDCTGAIPISAGVNPQPPSGSANFFSNFGATVSAGYPNELACGVAYGMTEDVFFAYTAPTTTFVSFSVETPPGFGPGTLQDAMISVHTADSCPDGAPSLGCAGAIFNAPTLLTAVTGGATYYLRVGSWGYFNPTGTFRVTVTENAAAPNDDCGAAPALGGTDADGVASALGDSTSATNSAVPGAYAGQPLVDVWFRYTPPQTVSASLQSPTNNAPFVEILSGNCAGMTSLALATYTTAPVTLQAGQTYYLRAMLTPGAPSGPFPITLHTKPINDEPAAALPLSDGLNPAAPSGSATQYFTNRGATATPVGPAVAGTNHDVFFTYVATATTDVVVSLCPEPGFASEPFDGEMYVFQGATQLAYGDEECSSMPRATFAATAGATYSVQVGGWSSGERGTFRFRVEPQFTLRIDSPSGPGSVRIANAAGVPGAFYFTALTVVPGAFPNGWFFGVELSPIELFLQLSSPAPFTGVLDATGGSTFSLTGVPSLTLYGVTATFGPGFLEASPAVSYTIP
jgi:hypothetical protein